MTTGKSLLCLATSLAAALCAGAGTPSDSKSGNRVLLLADFEESDVAEGWKTVNDNVMGGRSKGGPSFDNGILTFKGATNTNGGGFSSIRTEPGDWDLSGMSGLLIRAKGDGRTFKAEMRTDVTMRDWTVPFRADFETVKGEWKEFYLPFESFTPSFFGRSLSDPPALDPSKVSALGFMIYDKKDGPFTLEVDWVKAVTRGESVETEGDADSIVSAVLANKNFSTLATALGEADLVKVLQGKGPFTVFAPTDEAFAKLPVGTLKDLLKPENRAKLQAILTYHVAAGSIELATALSAGTAKTVQGAPVTIAFAKGKVKVNDAAILDADITCSNGVIHVIDSVLLPPAPANDLASVAKRAGSFSTLLAAVKAAGLEKALSGDGPLTILAPTDAAFKALPKGTVENLLKKENRDQLMAVLSYHVIAGKVSAGDALNAKKAKTLNGAEVEFAIVNGQFKANGATISATDIAADNGVIHVIDAVLLPPTKASTGSSDESSAKVTMRPLDRIEKAIDQGVPVFNGGDHGKCAAIYKECLTALAQDESIDEKLRSAMQMVIKKGAGMHSSTERAWLYRRGLDHLYTAISKG